MKSIQSWIRTGALGGLFAFGLMAASAEESSEVATMLSGKLIKLQDGAAAAAEITGNPEYFVFYHSASW